MNNLFPAWMIDCLRGNGIELWGVADLRAFETPQDRSGKMFQYAISFAVAMDPVIMNGIQNGPNRAYADAYTTANRHIDHTAGMLADGFKAHRFQARAIDASLRSDPKNIRGDFPHKTAATRAGLGWIGRHCQLITGKYGPWVRLGTVFTDMRMPVGAPVERQYCGTCTRCVDACPAGALHGGGWSPGTPREDLLDARACDRWKKDNYPEFHGGHNCGICSAVCPYGQKRVKTQRT